MFCRLILLFSLCADIRASNFLVISPLFGHSHTNFMGKIADTLTDAGHDVTVFMPIMDTTLVNKTGLKTTKNLIMHPVDPRVEEMFEIFRTGMMSNIWTMGTDVFSLLQMSQNMSKSFAYECEHVINDEALWSQLKEKKFDAGIAEPFNLCWLAMFEALGIPFMAASSTTQMDSVAYAIGEPLAPSYVPSMTSGAGPKMGILERMGNGISVVLGMHFFTGTYKAEMTVLRNKFGADFWGYEQILSKMSYFLTNSNSLLNYPRPIIHKTVDIGGITVPEVKTAVADLGEWDTVLNERKHTIFVSFGSVAKSKDMPEVYKKTLLKVFESMPDVTFIWKYENPTKMADHLDNVHISPWLPQNALLADHRLSAFMTHGGLGSTIEVSYLGKPAIFVPLFAEQPRNAAMLAQHGGALVLEKNDLTNANTIQNAFKTIINDKSYSENAKKLSEMLQNAPSSPKQTLIKHAEFVARFGSISQLDPYGRQLSIFEYYFLDVILLLFVIVFTVYKLLSAIVRKVYSACKSTKKNKRD